MCDNCVLPGAPVPPLGWSTFDAGAWIRWMVGWIGWLGGWFGWLACRIYFVILAPLLCFLSAWFRFIILWLKANTIDFVVDLLSQIVLLILALVGLLWATLCMFWDMLLLVLNAIGTLGVLIRTIVSAITDTSVEFVDVPAIALCIWGEVEWVIHNRTVSYIPTPFELFLYLLYANVIWNVGEWTLKTLSSSTNAAK
jgi:hypothetical protein